MLTSIKSNLIKLRRNFDMGKNIQIRLPALGVYTPTLDDTPSSEPGGKSSD